MIMKKIIKLNESDLLRIIKSVISEQIKQGFGGDPYQYKKVGNNYFYATKVDNHAPLYTDLQNQ